MRHSDNNKPSAFQLTILTDSLYCNLLKLIGCFNFDFDPRQDQLARLQPRQVFAREDSSQDNMYVIFTHPFQDIRFRLVVSNSRNTQYFHLLLCVLFCMHLFLFAILKLYACVFDTPANQQAKATRRPTAGADNWIQGKDLLRQGAQILKGHRRGFRKLIWKIAEASIRTVFN